MALDNESFNKQLYDLLKVRGYNPVPKNSKNQNVDASQLADVIEFQFTKDGENYGKAWASIDDAKNVIIYYDEAQADSPEGSTPGLDYDDSWSGFLKHVKSWAQRKQLSFELLNKDRLNDNMKQREYVKMKENLREGYYSMGKQASYSDAVPTVKIILQHTRQIQEGEQRYRNIAKIFLENTQGERILAPTTRPGIAQVYARHLAEGGVPNDTRWNHIKSICEEYQKMAGFVRATRNGQFNESAQQLVNEGINHYHKLRESLGKLRGHRGYNMYFESWTPALMEDESEENNLNELFVQETMDPRIETAMPILSRLRKHVSEMAEVKSLSGWADDIINEKIDLQLEGDEVEQVDEMYHVDAVSTHEFRQELNGRLAAQKALAKATKKLDAIQKPKSQAAHTKALKDMDKYPAAQFAKTRKGDGKVHTNESVKQLVEYEKFTDENGVTWNDEGDSDKGHTNWGRGQGRNAKKAGDKFTDKSGRRWVRYAKADGSLGVRPLKEVEQIDESGDTDQGQETLKSYKEKAKKDKAVAGEKLWYLSVTKGPTQDKWALAVQRDKRRKGIQRANARIKDKEAEQIDEIGNTSQDSKEGLLFAVFVSHPKKTDGEQERKVIRITGTDDMRAGGAHAQNHFTQQGYKVHKVQQIQESVEQIDEMLDKTAISYNNKAADDITDRRFNDRDGQNDRKIRNREKGMALAQAKLGWGKAKVPATSSASFESRLNEISDTELEDYDDYLTKKKVLQDLLRDPEASNPEFKKQIQQRMGRLEQQRAKLNLQPKAVTIKHGSDPIAAAEKEADEKFNPTNGSGSKINPDKAFDALKGGTLAWGALSSLLGETGMNEGMGEADMIVQDIISGEQDAYSILSNPASQEEKYVSQLLQKEFDDVVIETGLNPDDDLEEILNLAVEQLAKKYNHSAIDDSEVQPDFDPIADRNANERYGFKELDEVDMGQADRTLRSNPSGDDGKMSQSMGLNKAAHQMGYDHYLDVPDDEISKLHALSKKIRNGEVDEDLDANQKRAGQLGPTEKIGPKGAVGKLVGANESVEHDPLDDIKRLLGK
jgi:hypothetical protein